MVKMRTLSTTEAAARIQTSNHLGNRLCLVNITEIDAAADSVSATALTVPLETLCRSGSISCQRIWELSETFEDRRSIGVDWHYIVSYTYHAKCYLPSRILNSQESTTDSISR